MEGFSDWSPKDYPVRLAGHGLIREGSPRFRSAACERNPECREYAALLAAGVAAEDETMCSSGYNDGHARCSCGAESPHVPSQGKRRTWHKDHKRKIAAGVDGEEGRWRPCRKATS